MGCCDQPCTSTDFATINCVADSVILHVYTCVGFGFAVADLFCDAVAVDKHNASASAVVLHGDGVVFHADTFQMVARKRVTLESIQYSLARVSSTWALLKPWESRASITCLRVLVMVLFLVRVAVKVIVMLAVV